MDWCKAVLRNSHHPKCRSPELTQERVLSLIRTNPMIPFKESTGSLHLTTAPVQRAVLLHTPPPKTHHYSGPAWSSPRYRHIQRASVAESPVGLSFRFDRLPSHFSHPDRRYSSRPRDHRHHKSGPCVTNSPSPPADASAGITPSHTGNCQHSTASHLTLSPGVLAGCITSHSPTIQQAPSRHNTSIDTAS